MAIKVFTDTNIVIDLIENRDFEREAVHAIFNMAEADEIQVYVSETVITNSLYITGLAEQLYRLLKIVKLCCFKKTTFNTGLTGKIKDREDAILYFGALENDMDYFITRNVKDFKSFQQSRLPVLTAKQFVNSIS
ncbi:MAG: PIN domain-containing protein [Chitinophagaceae bacterium]